MLDHKKKVLACVDRSDVSVGVTRAAAWVAQRLSLELELLHVLDRHPEMGSGEDHSGSIGFNAQEALLSDLAERDRVRVLEMRDQGRLHLTRLRQLAQQAGTLRVDIRQRHGELVQAVLAQQPSLAVLVAGRQTDSVKQSPVAVSARLQALVRQVQCPVLVGCAEFSQPSHVMVAFSGAPSSMKALELVCQSPLFQGMRVSVVLVGENATQAQKTMTEAQGRCERWGRVADFRVLSGAPGEVLGHYALDQGVDLVAMGAYSHSFFRGLLFGSRTNTLLETIRTPALLVR